MYMTQQPHISVLLASVLDLLRGTTGTIVDATFGAGGYTRALLTQNPTCRVIAFDRDSKTVAPFAERINADFSGRFTYVPDCFANLSHHITQPVEAIVADLGVSSMQIDTPDRGFSWRFEAPLDMRMGTQSLTAADIVCIVSRAVIVLDSMIIECPVYKDIVLDDIITSAADVHTAGRSVCDNVTVCGLP